MVCTVVGVHAQKPAIPRDAALEAKIEKTLAKMTLDEKIGQMLELNLDVMGKMTVENAKVDREKVRSVLQQYGRSENEINEMLKQTDQQILDRFFFSDEVFAYVLLQFVDQFLVLLHRIADKLDVLTDALLRTGTLTLLGYGHTVLSLGNLTEAFLDFTKGSQHVVNLVVLLGYNLTQ